MRGNYFLSSVPFVSGLTFSSKKKSASLPQEETMYRDRVEVGKNLASALESFRNQKNTVVVAIPRGGVILGHAIAKALNLQLELAIFIKLEHPKNPERIIGAVSMSDFIIDEEHDIHPLSVSEKVKTIQKKLKTRYEMYVGEREPLDLSNKTVIIVDDGVTTGETIMDCVKLLKKVNPNRIIIAIPRGPDELLAEIGDIVDKVVCLDQYDSFDSAKKFTRVVSDMEIRHLLEQYTKAGID